MGLHEDAVDLLQIDDAGLIADGLDERAKAEIFGATQQALARTHDEGERVLGEGVVPKARAVELGEDKRRDGFRRGRTTE